MNSNENTQFPQTVKELEAFIDRYQNRLVHHAFFKVGDKNDAEDIVQDIIIRMYEERERFKNIENPLAYIYRMISNSCVDKTRKRNRVDIRPIDSNEALNKHTVEFVSQSEEKEEFERINNILSNLPNEQNEVVRLRIIDEMSFVEIAKVFEIPVTTVKSRFKYGIDKLKNIYRMKKEAHNEL